MGKPRFRETSHLAHLAKDRGDNGERSKERRHPRAKGKLCPRCDVAFVNAECPQCGDRDCSPAVTPGAPDRSQP